jgi:hypothetical protein
MVTDDLRLWSPAWEGAPLEPLLFTMVGPMAGTAGLMGLLPFTGETDARLPCCAFCGPPTATGGVALDAIGGDEIFLVAFAYELRAVGGAGPAATLADSPEAGEVAAAAVWEVAMGGFCAFEMDALIRRRRGGWQARASWCEERDAVACSATGAESRILRGRAARY